MANVLKSVIQTIFTTKGADEVEGAATRVGRAQTRLGQSSASAGRQFAAQSSGLGGLVGAYAGAAATTFALSAAFNALSKAAIASQTLQGLDTLAANFGISGKSILASVQDITKGQLSIVSSAQSINLALSAGFNQDQIKGLASVAIKASRALGRDLSDSMDRVIKGSAKMEAELLDELGIYTKIGPATRAYATSLGISVTKLTEFQRRQAFANAVIAEGQRKYEAINTTIPTTAEKIQAFGALILNLSNQLGMLVADSLGPLVSFLTNNTGAAFATLGIAISMIASKGLTALGAEFATINKWFIQAGMSAESFTRSLLLISESAASSSKAISEIASETMKLSDAEANSFKTLQESAKSRSLTRGELKTSQALIAKSITNTETEVAQQKSLRDASLRAISTANQVVDSKRAAYEAAKQQLEVDKQQGASASKLADSQKAVRSTMGQLGAATKAYNAAQGANAITAEQAGTKVLALNADLVTLRGTQEQITKASSGFRASLAGALSSIGTGISTVVSGYTTLFTGLLNGATKLFFLVNIFTLIGSAIANAIGKGEEFQGFLVGVGSLIKGLFTDQKAAASKSAFMGITANALSDLEKVDSNLKNIDSFKFKEKKIFGITIDVEKTKEQLVTEVSSLLSDASNGFQKSVTQAASSGKAIAGSLIGNLLGSLAILIPGIGPVIGPLLGRAIGTGLGFAIGSIWDYFSQVPDIPPEVAAGIRKKFADSLDGLAPDIQDKLVTVLSTLEQKYGAAAKIDPAARAALKAQEQLVFESGKYLDDIESVSNLMTALGQTADQVVKNFTFDDSAKRAVSSISAAFAQIGTRKLTFEFVDVTDPAVEKLLYSDTVTSNLASQLQSISGITDNILVQEAGGIDQFTNNILTALDSAQAGAKKSGISMQEYITMGGLSDLPHAKEAIDYIQSLGINIDDLVKKMSINSLKTPIENAISSLNEFSQGSARLAIVQSNLSKGIDDGSLTLEQYTQGLANAKDALANTQSASVGVAETLNKLKEARKGITDVGLGAALDAQIAQYTAIAISVSNQLKTQKEINAELAKAETSLRAQSSIHEFLQSQMVSTQNPLTTEMELVGVGAKNKLQAQVAYLGQFVTSSQALVDQYDKLKSQLTPLGLTDAQVQEVLTTPADKADQLKASLESVAGIKFEELKNGLISISTGVGSVDEAANKATVLIKLMDGKSGQIVSDSKDAQDAIVSLATKAVESLPQVMDQAIAQFKTTRDDITKTLAESAIDAPVLSFKAKIDVDNINRQISEINQQQVIDDLNLQVQLVQAKKEAKDLKPVPAAIQENALQQQILAARKSLIELEYTNFLSSQTQKLELIYKQADADKAKIDIENAAQKTAIEAQRDNIKATVAVYKAVTADQNAVNQNLITGIIDSANQAGDTWAATFHSGAIVIGSAIQDAMNKAFNPDNVGPVSGGTAAKVNLGPLTSTLDTSFTDYSSAVDDTIKALDASAADKKKAVDAARDASAAQIVAEDQAEKAKHDNKLANLDTESKIETENAKKRVADAKAEGKELEKLTGRLAELKSSIQGSVETSLMSINSLLITGEGSIGEIIGSLFKSIEEEVFKQTIATPLANIVSSWLVGGIQKAFNNKDILGSPLSGVAGSLFGSKDKDLTKNVLGDKAVDAGAKAFQTMGKKISNAANGASSIIGSAASTGAQAVTGASQVLATSTQTSTGVVAAANTSGAATLMSSLGPILAIIAVIAGIAALFGGHKKKASSILNGTTTTSTVANSAALAVPTPTVVQPISSLVPQMASGGLRDRAPTLLEPGEFVIRKPMVNKIGTSALEAMNATGKTPGAAPVININNEGSPKTATASTPRFDGEKYVIDIVMRDLANNGPIRKSLRGGAI